MSTPNSSHGRFRSRIQLLSLVLILGVVCSGCVWLRLLSMKNQLMRFDENFRIEVNDGFLLHFQNPTLYGTDLTYLANMNPSFTTDNGEESRFVFLFEKLLPSGEIDPEASPLVFYSRMNEDGKMVTFKFARIFLDIVPAEFMEHSIRALARAQVDTKNRKLRADTTELAQGKLVPPALEDILNGLGEPLSSKTTDEGMQLSYRYRLRPPSDASASMKRGIANLDLIFNPDTNTLSRFRGKFSNLKLSVNYQKILNEQKRIHESTNARTPVN